MEDATTRFRAVIQAEEKALHEAGSKAGREWASKDATLRELKRLSKFRDGCELGLDYELEVLDNVAIGNPGAGAGVAAVVNGSAEGYADRHDWETLVGAEGDDAHETPFVRGFVEGALEVWRAV